MTGFSPASNVLRTGEVVHVCSRCGHPLDLTTVERDGQSAGTQCLYWGHLEPATIWEYSEEAIAEKRQRDAIRREQIPPDLPGLKSQAFDCRPAQRS